MTQEIFDSCVRASGDHAGVFEYDGAAGYFYLYKVDPSAGDTILDAIQVTGMRAGDKPDAIRDEMNELSTEEERGYTMKQRVDRIKLLMSDQLPAPHQIDVSDGERLVELFETLPASRRKALYRMATGSDFTGDISWKTWNLRADQKARLVALIGQP